MIVVFCSLLVPLLYLLPLLLPLVLFECLELGKI
jgi:hypothetical protein